MHDKNAVAARLCAFTVACLMVAAMTFWAVEVGCR